MNLKFSNNTRITLFLISLSIYLLVMLLPRSIFPEKIPGDDTFVHLFFTFILSISFFLINSSIKLINKTLIIIIFVIFKEYLQMLSNTRGFGFNDILTDIIAVLIAIIIYKKLNYFKNI
jgi:hypothetical protein